MQIITQRTIRRAMKKAEQSICKFRISALGFNKAGVCVISRTNKPKFSRKGGGIHAEEQIFQVALKRGIVKILICRIGRGGDLLPIEPCPSCRATAEKLGIKIETIQEER